MARTFTVDASAVCDRTRLCLFDVICCLEETLGEDSWVIAFSVSDFERLAFGSAMFTSFVSSIDRFRLEAIDECSTSADADRVRDSKKFVIFFWTVDWFCCCVIFSVCE